MKEPIAQPGPSPVCGKIDDMEIPHNFLVAHVKEESTGLRVGHVVIILFCASCGGTARIKEPLS